jgi:hypothetical protein
MDYSAKLVTYRPLPTKLLAFGFAENKTVYTYEKPCSDPVFFFRVTLTKEKLTLDLIDKRHERGLCAFLLVGGTLFSDGRLKRRRQRPDGYDLSFLF